MTNSFCFSKIDRFARIKFSADTLLPSKKKRKMAIARCSQFSDLIIGFINAGVLAIRQRFHMAKALIAHGYFRLFTSTPCGQGKQLHCAKLSPGCSNSYRKVRAAVTYRISNISTYQNRCFSRNINTFFFKYEILSI